MRKGVEMTKAQLEAEVARLAVKAGELLTERDVARETVEILRYSDVKKQTGLTVWVARNDPGKPVCVAGADLDVGYAVNVYYEDEVVVGVVITQGADTVNGTGFVPYGLLAENS